MGGDGLICVAVYGRTVGAPLARVWENVRDWEHLPWLHRGTFCDIEHVDSGSWGWRARVGLQPEERRSEVLIELRIDRANHRYCTSTLEGTGEGTEIWTRLEQVDPHRTKIEVRFLLPRVPASSAEAVGKLYTELYARLWDEDEAMMRRRQELLSRPGGSEPASPSEIGLGPLEEVRRCLPLVVQQEGRSYRVVDAGGELAAHATVCPHMLGPLDRAPIDENGCIRCPWHGYVFDVRTGCSTEGRRLRLDSPHVRIDPRTSEVSLVWPEEESARANSIGR